MPTPPAAQPIYRHGDELHAALAPAPGDPFPSLADAVYERLWKSIVNRDFPPGARLSEEALAKELGVSRTPVREALLRLGETGVVRISPRRGFSVPALTAEDVAELYDLRAAIETFAARRAAPLVDAAEVAACRALHEATAARASANSPAATEAFFRSDLALHELVQRCGGNRRSARLLTDVMGQLSLLSLRSGQDADSRGQSLREHGAILDALAARDAGRAAAAMEDHIMAVKSRALADLEAAASAAPTP